MEYVTLVDEHDRALGSMEKLEAHRQPGRMHRAFSVFVFNRCGELLLQRRAAAKYHFGGLWSNTCCGHPRPDEVVEAAASRRLQEEFGFRTRLHRVSEFRYVAHDSTSGLTEREYDHVLCGSFDGSPRPDPSEIDEWKWSPLRTVHSELKRDPGLFTPWFPIALAALEKSGFTIPGPQIHVSS